MNATPCTVDWGALKGKLRSLSADWPCYLALPSEQRFSLWAAAATEVDNEFALRTTGRVLLDLGCGPPAARRAANDLAPATYFGLDALPRAQPDVVAAVEFLPLGESSVDGINCISVLEHVYQPGATIAEMFRVLRPRSEYDTKRLTRVAVSYWRRSGSDTPDALLRQTQKRMAIEYGSHVT